MIKILSDKRKVSFIFVFIGIVVILLGVALLGFKATREIKQYRIKNDDIYMFFGNELFEFNSEITLDHDEITSMKIDGKTVELYSEPIYIKDKDEVILPSDMSIVYPLDGVAQKRLNYYSKLSLKNNTVSINNNRLKDYIIKNAFLYDGEDLYFFVDDTSIIIGKEKIDLPAFSYVSCKYKGDMYIFNYDTKKVTFYENVNTNVLATDGDYVVNMSYDIVEFNSDSVLLVKNIKKLPNLK